MVYTRSKEVAMRYVSLLIVTTAMILGTAGSTRGSSSPGPLLWNRTAVTASELSSLPVMKGDESSSKSILPAAWNSAVGQLFVAASAQDGKEDGKQDDKKEKNPPPPPSRSKRCPSDQKDDHRDNDHRDDKCGKGDDSKLP
jgi:hypothetical protein